MKVKKAAAVGLLTAALLLSGCSGAGEVSTSAPSLTTVDTEPTLTPTREPAPEPTPEPALEDAPSGPALTGAFVQNQLPEKGIDPNPYMGSGGCNIHHDGYNTDVTDAVLPLGICPEVNTSYEKTNAMAPPAIFYDDGGHAYCPLLGGIAIRDMDSQEVATLGAYIPAQHEEQYSIQSSYSFVDAETGGIKTSVVLSAE